MIGKKEFESWASANLEDQKGRTVIITGANSGIGYWTALGLAKFGAHVIIAGRNQERIDTAVESIAASIQNDSMKGSVTSAILDLASLNSVRKFSEKFNREYDSLDILINNAGLMMPPEAKTEDGFELQFGVNFLGHFYLTHLLHEKLIQTKNARVVTVSSIAHRMGAIDFDNLRSEKSYDARREYCQSKLANSVFALELARKYGDDILSVACHPGITKSELQRHVDPAFLKERTFMETWKGSLPTLVAATKADIKYDDYYGPDGEKEWAGFPALGIIEEHALNLELGNSLWEYALKNI